MPLQVNLQGITDCRQSGAWPNGQTPLCLQSVRELSKAVPSFTFFPLYRFNFCNLYIKIHTMDS